LLHSRIDPADDDETLDDVASAEGFARSSAVGSVRQGREGRGADEVQNEGDGEEDEVRKDAEDAVTACDLEPDRENDCGQCVSWWAWVLSSRV
jgi:hypothetical protein